MPLPDHDYDQTLRQLIEKEGIASHWRTAYPPGDPRELLRLQYLEMRERVGYAVPPARERHAAYVRWRTGGKNVITFEERLERGRARYSWKWERTHSLKPGTIESVDPRAGRRQLTRHLQLMAALALCKSANPRRAQRALIGTIYVFRDLLDTPRDLRRCTYRSLAARFRMTEKTVRSAVVAMRKTLQRVSLIKPTS